MVGQLIDVCAPSLCVNIRCRMYEAAVLAGSWAISLPAYCEWRAPAKQQSISRTAIFVNCALGSQRLRWVAYSCYHWGRNCHLAVGTTIRCFLYPPRLLNVQVILHSYTISFMHYIHKASSFTSRHYRERSKSFYIYIWCKRKSNDQGPCRIWCQFFVTIMH